MRRFTNTQFSFGGGEDEAIKFQLEQFGKVVSDSEKDVSSNTISSNSDIAGIADPRQNIFEQISVKKSTSFYDSILAERRHARNSVKERNLNSLGRSNQRNDALTDEEEKNAPRVNLCFLHASPSLFANQLKHAVDVKMKEQLFQLPMLNFRKESLTIKEALQESGRQIYYHSSVATRSSIEDTIRRRPNVLHISCHGIQNSETTLGPSFSQCKQFGHLLLFENEFGGGELVSAQELQKFMVQERLELDVVFVAACDSQGIGRVFQRCGAKHVVCVEQNRLLLDEASISFTKTFYCRLFQGEPACKAFQAAKNAVTFKIHEAEADLFMLLISDSHQRSLTTLRMCTEALSHAPKGSHQCISQHNLAKLIPSRLNKIQFRDRDMSKLLTYLLTDNSDRIVPLIGLQGIGKSSLARNTLHYVAERKMFTHGVILVQLKDVKTCFAMIKLLMRAILTTLDLNSEGKRKFSEKTMTKSAIFDYLICFFNNRQEEELKKHDRAQFNKQQSLQLFLLCLDNAEGIILNDKEEFVNFLAIVYDQCPNLYIIVTSFCHFGSIPNQIMPKPFVLQRLKHHDSAKLFLNNCGKVTSHQMLDLVLADSNFPQKKFLSHVRHFEEMTQEMKEKELLRKLQNSQNWVAALAYHDMIKQFLGNPTSIMMIAAIVMNSMIKPNTLVEMYQVIKREMNIVINDLDYESDKIAMPKMIENIMGLKAAAETSVKLLESTQLDDINLLYFLGCLPGGVTEEQLCEMWGPDKLGESLGRLKKLSFLEIGVDKLMLTPSINSYIEDSMDAVSKYDYMLCICDYYQSPLYECFKKISRIFSNDRSCTIHDHTLSELSARSKLVKSDGLKECLIKLGQTFNETSEEKTMFEQLQNDLQNIEHCLDYVLEAAKTKKTKSKPNLGEKARTPYYETFGLSTPQDQIADSADNKEVNNLIEDIECCSNLPEEGDNISLSDQPQLKETKTAIKGSQSSDIQDIELEDLRRAKYLKLLADFKQIRGKKPGAWKNLQINVDLKQKINTQPAAPSLSPKEEQNLADLVHQLEQKMGFEQNPLPLAVTPQVLFDGSKKQSLDGLLIKLGKKDSFTSSKSNSSSNARKSESNLEQRCLAPLDISYNRANKRRQTQLIAGLNMNGLFAIQEEASIESKKRNSFKQQPMGISSLIKNSEKSNELSSSSNEEDSSFEREIEADRQSIEREEEELDEQHSILVNRNRPSLVTTDQQMKPVIRPSDVRSEFLGYGQANKSSQLIRPNIVQRTKSAHTGQPNPLWRMMTLGIGEESLSEGTVSDSSSNSADRRNTIARENSFASSSSSNEEIEERKEPQLQKPIFAKTVEQQPELRKSQSFQQELSNSQATDFFSELVGRNSIFARQFSLKQNMTGSFEDTSKFARLSGAYHRVSHKTMKTKFSKRVCIRELILDSKSSTELSDAVRRMNIQKRVVSVTPRVIKKIQSQKICTKKSQQAPWNPMDAIEKFIVYLAANSYLIKDSNHSVRISQTKFLGHSALFQGNWFRFSALTNMQLYSKSNNDEKDQMLDEAEKSLLQAELLYSDQGKKFSMNRKNSHGLGLSNFTLGYLYDHFAEYYAKGDISIEQVKHMAQKLYIDAFNNFAEIEHILGKLVCKQHTQDDTKDALIDTLRNQLDDINELHSSRYIMRDHGMAVSLMTEIVSDNPQYQTITLPMIIKHGFPCA